MLSTDKGATLDETDPRHKLAASHGARAHRACQRGYDVRLVRGDRGTVAAYRVATPAAGARVDDQRRAAIVDGSDSIVVL